jgi:hypothetical protein
MGSLVGKIFSHPPVIIGGRQPVKPGRHPHLAEIAPEIAISRFHIIDQIRKMILAGKSVVVLGMPGVGKSFAIEKIAQELDLSFDNQIVSESSDPILLDDRPSFIRSFPDRPKIIDLINQGKQFIFVSPPYFEHEYIEFVSKCQTNRKPEVAVLPPADYTEFANYLRHAFSNNNSDIRMMHKKEGSSSLSEKTLKILFGLTGGNFRIAEYALDYLLEDTEEMSCIRKAIVNGKELSSVQINTLYQEFKFDRRRGFDPPLSLIYSNFKSYYIHLASTNKFIDGEMRISDFWKPEINRWVNSTVFRLLKYGLLKIEGDRITFRGSLVREAFVH